MDQSTIIIAGATVGIGRATSKLLASKGAKLILIARDPERLKALKDELQGEHDIISYDLSNTAGIETLISGIVAKHGPIHGYVNCIGMRSRKPLKFLNPAVVSEVMNLNFGSFLETMRCLVKKGNYSTPFSAVTVSSIASQRGGPGVTAYAASKAAMEASVRCLAIELAPKDIRVNAVVPAQINSPEFDRIREMQGEHEDPTLKRQYLGLGEPEQVASAIAFLLAKESGFISGASIPVDGGYLSS